MCTNFEVVPLGNPCLVGGDFAHLCPGLTVCGSLKQQLRPSERAAGHVHLADGETALDRLILTGNFDVKVLTGQAEIILSFVQLVAIHGADLLIAIAAGLEVIKGHLTVGVSRTIRDLVAFGVKEPIHHTNKRLLGVGVNLQDLDASGDQLVLTGDFQHLSVLI